MRKRLIYISGTVLLAFLVGLVVWQTSFHFGDFAPSSPQQTLILWALSTLILFIQLVNGIVGFGVWLLEKPATDDGGRTTDDSAKDALGRTKGEHEASPLH